MKSWLALPALPLRPAGEVSAGLLAAGWADYRSAAGFVCRLPYGRNSDRDDPLSVLREGRGTCSTKHALMAMLAAEQHLPITLRLGIYEMSERNTPAVGPVLRRHGLESIPEAHCYLVWEGERFDITRERPTADESITGFLHEETITAGQIGQYKTATHRRFLAEWLVRHPGMTNQSLERLWTVREECIAALAEK